MSSDTGADRGGPERNIGFSWVPSWQVKLEGFNQEGEYTRPDTIDDQHSKPHFRNMAHTGNGIKMSAGRGVNSKQRKQQVEGQIFQIEGIKV